MQHVKFLFGIHNHQPIGNFDFVFEEAYNKSYLPFLQVAKNFPSFKFAIHFTGILLDWLKENHPELIQIVKAMVQGGQLEVMTGGYYEPILSIIPRKDRVAQIKKLSAEVERLFDYQPQGMWLAERVWEPTLPSSIAEAGVKYTIIDDTHFKYAGLTDEQLNGYYLTENLGDIALIFPISKQLRYTIPFQDPQNTIDHLRHIADQKSGQIVVFADDGEKFGVWPNTYNHVYENGWLEQFLQAVVDNNEWIKTQHFSDVIKEVEPAGTIYLPTASYSEMMHWALFPPAFKAYEEFEHKLQGQPDYDEVSVFVRGGFWRNFLAKYPEVNDMQKKMLHVSKKLWSLPEDKQREAKIAFDQLWAGQCNCPYWHGVFGGLYLSHLRDAIFRNLIMAEQTYDRIAETGFPLCEIMDLNVDGKNEVALESELANAYINPDKGGVMYEMDFKPCAKNLLDTMTRREEGYHKKLDQARLAGEPTDSSASIHDLILTKEVGLQNKLFYDFHERKSFVDHILSHDTTLENFAAVQYKEINDFPVAAYQIMDSGSDSESAWVRMKRDSNDPELDISIEKTITLRNKTGEISADYVLINKADRPQQLWFGVELNFALQAGHADDRYYYNESVPIADPFLDSSGVLKNHNEIGLRDEWRKIDIRLHLDKAADIWRFPIETISLSEGGFERVYQSSVVMPNWKISLENEWRITVKQVTRKLEK